jgi:hypothetical protein
MSELNSSQDKLELKSIFEKVLEWTRVLKEHKKKIFLFSFLAALISFGYAYLDKPKYTAVLSFTVEDEKSNTGVGIGSLASQFGFDMAGGQSGSIFSGPSLMELIKTRLIVERALLTKHTIGKDNTTLLQYFVQHSSFNESWSKNGMLKKANFSNYKRGAGLQSLDSAVGKVCNSIIDKNITVFQKDKKVNILYIQVVSENEIFSKLFAQSLVEEASGLYKEIKTGKSMQTVLILEKQADSVRNALNAAMSGVATYNDKTFNLNSALVNTIKLPSSKKQVDIQANTVMLTQLVQNLEATKLLLRKETPLIQVIDEPILPLPKNRMSRSITAILGGISVMIFLSFIIIIYYEIKKNLQ